MKKINAMCFGCGPVNPVGLKLEFGEEEEIYFTEFTAGEEHQGYPGLVHGGIIAAVLDELMANQVYRQGYEAFTADLQLRFQKPVPIKEKVRFYSRVTLARKRLFVLEGWAEFPPGEVLVRARSKMLLEKATTRRKDDDQEDPCL